MESPMDTMDRIFSNLTGGDLKVSRTDGQGKNVGYTPLSTMTHDAQTNLEAKSNDKSTEGNAFKEMEKNESAVNKGGQMEKDTNINKESASGGKGLMDSLKSGISNLQEKSKEFLSSSNALPSSTNDHNVMTSMHGFPLGDVTHSYNIQGFPVVSDGALFEKQQTFNRAKIVERAVHACGSGGFGYFELTKDMSQYTKATLFSDGVGTKTPLVARFSTVTYGKEYPDSARNPRGLAFKFYTSDGNYDILSVNFPVFFTRDPALGPDNIRSQQRNPQNFQVNFDSIFDWMGLVPESMLANLWFWSDHGTPNGWRFMDGYPCHTFKWVNSSGQIHYVRYRFKCVQGIKNFNYDEAVKMCGVDPDYAKRDLWQLIMNGGQAEWTFQVQIMKESEVNSYEFDPFDCSRLWLEKDYPYIDIGKIVINKNPDNYHRDIEQVAFSPGSMIPGIEASPDPLLQFRTFLYRDAQYYRLGVNFHQIPVNCPFMRAKMNGLHPLNRDGKTRVDANGGIEPHYYPNSFGPTQAPKPDLTSNPTTVYLNSANSNQAVCLSKTSPSRHAKDPNSDYIQPRLFYFNDLDEQGRTNLCLNIARGLQLVTRDEIKLRFLVHCYKIAPILAENIWKQYQQLIQMDAKSGNMNNLNEKAMSSPLSWKHIEKYGKEMERVVETERAYAPLPMPID